MTGLGVQLYSVRDDLGARLPATLDRLAAMGYTHIEPYDIPSDTSGLKRAADAAGLRIASAHAKITLLDRNAVLDAMEELEASTVVIPWVDPAVFTSRDTLARFADDVAGAVEAAAARGVEVGFHNHDTEFAARVDGRSGFEVMHELLDPRVVYEIDAYWASVGGADVFALVPELGPRVRFLHVKSEPYDGRHEVVGPDVSARLDELLRLAAPNLEMPVVEVVVDGDVFPFLERNAHFFAERGAA